MPKQKTPLYERFWAKVEKRDGCWKWHGATVNGGYGVINKGGRGEGLIRANRYSYVLHYGNIPDGLYVCHTCDNPECTNPEHLYAGTPQENQRDISDRKRHPASRKTHCKRGHEFTPENTIWRGCTRMCRKCKNLRSRERLREKRGSDFGKISRQIKTHCPQGHEYTEENTYLNPRGFKECVICRKERGRRFRDKRKAVS